MDKKQFMAGTLAALTVVGSTPAAFAAQTDTQVPYAVMSAQALEDAGISMLSQEEENEIAPLASTLQDQINAAEAGVEKRITLQSDVSEDLTIPADKKIVLDLGGFKLTNVSGHTITNNGTLTIEGTGTVDNVTHARAAVYNNVGGTVTLNGGTYTRSKENGSNKVDSGGNSYYNIQNLGEMTINDGVTVRQTGNFSSMIASGFYDGTDETTNPKLVINGGTFSGGMNTIKNDDRGILEIHGGTFTNVRQAALMNWNEATITGGSFTANGAEAVIYNGYLNDAMDCGKLTISGGEFTASGNSPVIQQNDNLGLGPVQINGGTFTTGSGKIIGVGSGAKTDVTIVKGEFVTTNTENLNALKAYVDPSSTYDPATGKAESRTQENAAASVNGKYYASLADAVAAAEAGDTVTLLADATERLSISQGKVFTLDLGGNTLTHAGGYVLDIDGDLTIKNGTVKMTGAKDTAAIWLNKTAKLTVESDATVSVSNNAEDNCYCIAFYKDCTAAELTVKGTLEGGSGITVNGLITDTSVQNKLLVDGATINAVNHGIYQAGNASTSVNNSTITGSTGIEVRAGNIETNNSSITGNGEFSCVNNPNGTTTTGVGIAIAQHTTTLPIDVKISGGTISGTYSVYEANPQKNSTDAISKVEISISGGSFDGNVHSEDIEKFITGGNFSSSLKDTDYLADTLKAELNTGKGDVPYSYYLTVNEAKEAAKTLGGGTVTDLTATPSTTSFTVTLKFADDVTVDQTITVAENGIVVLPMPTRAGYAFQGWTDGTNTYQGGDAYTVTKEATLTATWKKTAFTVTLDYANNGETATENRGANDGDTITLPTPTRSGRYAFVHWTDGTNTYAGGTNYTVTKDATLTAVWRYIGSSSSGTTTSSYPVSVPRFDNGSISVTPGSASKGTTVTITVKPNDGYELSKLTVTDQSGNRLSLNDQGNDKYTFTMPSSKVNVDAAFSKIETTMNFWDVKQGDYYYDAVKWAVEKGITEGTGANFFSPNASCTRAQMVTFLWRAAGSPAPKSTVNPFTDVSANDYFYNAVLWAVENGITTGASADRFAPGATVSPAQTATFLYRANGSPAASGASFSDVAADEYYANAVAWAVQNGITTGTGNGKFSPNADCTRGQIVTLLYRADTK